MERIIIFSIIILLALLIFYLWWRKYEDMTADYDNMLGKIQAVQEKDPKFLEDNLYYFFKERENRYLEMFKDIKVHEGIILKNRHSGLRIFLLHGHHVDFMNSSLWRLTRFLVRYLWTPLESIGVRDRTRTAKNYKKKMKVGRRLATWAEGRNHILIAGHNHRPMFPAGDKAPYFNDGSCVHPRCITGIEISKGEISLVKWSVKTKANGSLYIGRDILAGPRQLE